MEKTTRICKVCGKPYEYCHTWRRVDNMFRWQDVACCEEHGRQYLKEVLKSRSSSAPVDANESKQKADTADEAAASSVKTAKASAKKSAAEKKEQDSESSVEETKDAAEK